MKSSHFSFNPNLGACVWGGGRGAGGFYHPSWVSLNNSETVKAVTLVFCSIQLLFIRDIRAKFGNPNLCQSPGVGQNPDEGISDFRIPDQSCKNENYHDSITTHDNDMKLGPVTAIEKKKKKTPQRQKNWRWRHFGKLWRHCLLPDSWPIYSHPEARFRTHGL